MTLKDINKVLIIVVVAITLFSVGLAFHDTVIKNNFPVVEVDK